MVEYLKNYQKLLELKEINEQEIKENQSLIDETNQKWAEEKEKESNIDLEIKTLNKEYNEIMEAKEQKMFERLVFVLGVISMISIIVSSIFNPICLVLAPPLVCAISGIIYLMTFIISKTTSVFDKQFEKDKKIIDILEQIKTKEKELSETKKIIDEYVQKMIRDIRKQKKLQDKREWIVQSIDELMRNYAQPIFEEQLKNHQEELENNQEHIEAKDNQQPKTKTRKQ